VREIDRSVGSRTAEGKPATGTRSPFKEDINENKILKPTTPHGNTFNVMLVDLKAFIFNFIVYCVNKQ
jgi:hypothetical protein